MGMLSSWDLSKALMSWGTPGKDIDCNYRMARHHSITNLERVRVTVQDCKSLPVAPQRLLDTRGCPLPSPPLPARPSCGGGTACRLEAPGI